jgi:multicomponent Na+:H+ antiporter subunit F
VLDGLLIGVVIFLLGTILVGLVRIARGPGPRDRLMALVLMSTTGVAVLLLLGQVWDLPALRDTALALVALASLIVLVRVGGQGPPR